MHIGEISACARSVVDFQRRDDRAEGNSWAPTDSTNTTTDSSAWAVTNYAGVNAQLRVSPARIKGKTVSEAFSAVEHSPKARAWYTPTWHVDCPQRACHRGTRGRKWDLAQPTRECEPSHTCTNTSGTDRGDSGHLLTCSLFTTAWRHTCGRHVFVRSKEKKTSSLIETHQGPSSAHTRSELPRSSACIRLSLSAPAPPVSIRSQLAGCGVRVAEQILTSGG